MLASLTRPGSSGALEWVGTDPAAGVKLGETSLVGSDVLAEAAMSSSRDVAASSLRMRVVSGLNGVTMTEGGAL